MSLYSSPPPVHSPESDKPTLLVCWWITLFCTTIIFLRVGGRFIRSEKLFREDRTVMFAVIPLFLRMALIHVVLLWGTNNAQFTWPLTETERRYKSIASGLVLVSRILYAASLWILKLATLDFFTRLTSKFWRRTHEVTLTILRGTLIVTFIAVVIADLAECQPFDHYWQVEPDPGGQCRQGYVQLLTMATSTIITDFVLVIFPVPIILASQMSPKKKIQLTLLFCLGLGPTAATIYRVVFVFQTHGSQQMRSLLASVEILFATAAANALVLGTFVRDRGTKKIKYHRASPLGVHPLERTSSRHPTIHRHWGSDEDLVEGLGFGLSRQYPHDEEEGSSRFGPALATLNHLHSDQRSAKRDVLRHNAPRQHEEPASSSQSPSAIHPLQTPLSDPGGLLLDIEASDSVLPSARDSFTSSNDPLFPYRTTPSPSMTASSSGLRRGSQTLLQDLSGLFHPFYPRRDRAPRRGTELHTIPQSPHEPAYDDDYHSTPVLIDAGGLLK